MKRTLGSLMLIAGLFGIGLVPAYAAENPSDQTLIVTTLEQYTKQHVLILTSPNFNLLNNDSLESLISQYTQSPDTNSFNIPKLENGNQNQNNESTKSNSGTNEPNPQSTGTDGMETATDGSELGNELNQIVTLKLIELYPNTNGNDKTDEFITLANTGDKPVNLLGWMLKDASGKTFTFQESILAPLQTLKLFAEESGLILNNGSEKLELIAPNLELIDSVSYDNTVDGETYIFNGNVWSWPTNESAPAPAQTETTVEPGLPSVQTDESAEATQPAPSESVKPQSENPKTLKLVELYPNTTGNDKTDEYIVIKNFGNQPVQLKGWSLMDATKKTYTFDEGTIEPTATFTLFSTTSGISLNNTEETLVLLTPTSEYVDSVTYDYTKDGEKYVREGDSWSWPSEQQKTFSQPDGEDQQTVIPEPIQKQSETQKQKPVQETGAIVEVASTTIQLVELYPNTSGDDKTDEYVVIKNTGDVPIELTGWMLKDAAGKTFLFADKMLNQNETYKVMASESGISLNNTSETLELIAPNNQLIDSVSYEKTKDGETLTRIENVWFWSSSVPATQPTTPQTIQMEDAQTNSSNGTNQSDDITTGLSITQVKTLADGAEVEIVATAIVAPGILGKQYLYVQDLQDAIQIYKHDAMFPNISPGSVLHIKGELSTSGSERRLKITKNGYIEIITQNSAPDALNMNIKDISEAQMGMLIQTSGIISGVSATKMQIEQDGIELEISISTYSGIDTSEFSPGQQLHVTGIVRPFGKIIKLSPRSQLDLSVTETEPTFLMGAMEPGKTTQQKSNQLIGTLIVAVSGAALLLWMAREYIHNKQHRYATSTLTVGTKTVS